MSPKCHHEQPIFQNPSDASWTSLRKIATTLDHNSPWKHPPTNIYRTSMEGSPNPQLVSAVRQGYLDAAADVKLFKSRCELHEEKCSRATKLQIHQILATRADQMQKAIGEIILNDEVIERYERELAAARETKTQLAEDVSRIKAKEEEDAREIKRKEDERDKFYADLKERYQTYEAFRYHKLGNPSAFNPSMISPPSPGDQTSSDLVEQGWEQEHGQNLEPEAAIAVDTDDQRQAVEPTGSHQHVNAAAAAAASPDCQVIGQAQTQGTETCQRQKRPTRESGGGPGPATPRPRKRARRLVEQGLHVTSTISFAEVFQGGHPSNKFEIVESPLQDGTWYILHCKEHKLCFGGNGKQAAAAAAKHLGSDAHGGTGTFVQHYLAINQFGSQVYDCDAEKAEKNNSMVKRSCADAGAFQGTINPIAGQPYITAYAGSRWVVMVLPTDDFAKVGVRGTFDSCTLAKKIPRCYTRRSVDGRLGWAEGFEDGGPKVQERRFPVRYFNEEEHVEWVSAEALKSCDLDDLEKCRGVCGAEAAREFYPKLEFYQRLAAEPDSGGDGQYFLRITKVVTQTIAGTKLTRHPYQIQSQGEPLISAMMATRAMTPTTPVLTRMAAAWSQRTMVRISHQPRISLTGFL